MKNIHILPTDKPSKLYLFKGRLILGDLVIVVFKNSGAINQHIYITSDEEIKVGDWCIDMEEYLDSDPDNYSQCFTYKSVGEDHWDNKKIILTTDQDLIKDGIQAIDDEFLEWFVKNPSCEEVGIQKQYQYHSSKEFYIDADYVDCTKEQYESIKKEIPTCPLRILYKIIIPKEEPKQIYYNTVGIENGVNVVKGQFNTQKEALDLANELNRKFPDLYYDWRETLIKEEPKQETLEEAAEKYIAKDNNNRYYNDFIAGAKWQSERMYSEEDMIEFGFSTYCYISELMGVPFNLMSENRLNAEEWFEQFKKK